MTHIMLFPWHKDLAPTIRCVGSEVQAFLEELKQPLERGVWRSTYPRNLLGSELDIDRQGYLRFDNRWYKYQSFQKRYTDEYRMIGVPAKKIPAGAIELYIQCYNVSLANLLLDPDPITRRAAKHYHKRILSKKK